MADMAVGMIAAKAGESVPSPRSRPDLSCRSGCHPCRHICRCPMRRRPIARSVGAGHSARQHARQNDKRQFQSWYSPKPSCLALNKIGAAARQRRADSSSLNRGVALIQSQRETRSKSARRRVGRQTRIAADRTEARGIDRLFLGRQLALIDRAMPGGGVFGLQQTGRRPMPAQPPTPESTATYCLPPCS